MGNKERNMESKLIWDLLPEEFPYEDKGCELFPSCLNCPFPDCIKEEPWGKERFLKSRRAERMMELRREGRSIQEIARIFEVSPRTVQRWLKVVARASLFTRGIVPHDKLSGVFSS
jgi:DNA-binding transcriptional ArsR family regulator